MQTQANADTAAKKAPVPKARKAKKAAKARKPSKAAKAKKASRTARKARKARAGGGKALSDFRNETRIRVVKGKEIGRAACFRTGQTVAQCLAAQKKAGFRGRRKYIRKQATLGRIAFKK